MVTFAPELGADVVENLAARGNPHAQHLLALAYRQAVAELLFEVSPTSPALRVILAKANAVLPEFDRYFDESDGPLTLADIQKLLAWLLEPLIPEHEARP
jgi:hypothetical protein